jgi:hypothetical protein
MRCPTEISDVLLDIVGRGLLRIRILGDEQKPDRCSIEADHIHNIPELLKNYSLPLLLFYWNTERPAFIEQSDHAEIESFNPPWDRLQHYICDLLEKEGNSS